MENLKIINGNGKATKEKVNILLDAAIEFFGSKYENVILDVIKDAYFYEWSNNQSANDVIDEITDNKSIIEAPPIFSCSKDPEAFYFLNRNKSKRFDQIIVSHPDLSDRDYHIMAHELFGHAVCGKINVFVRKQGKVYQRNGVAISNDTKSKNDILNEGFMETIATEIIQRTDRRIQDSSSSNYSEAKKSSDMIFSTLGKEKVLNALVFNKGNLERKYNFGSSRNEWKKLNSLLEKELLFRNILPIRYKAIINEIDKNLERFEKRKIKIR